MSFLTPKLKHRIQIQEAIQDPNSVGGMDRSYSTLITVWAGMKEDSEFITGVRGRYVRGTQTEDVDTHEFLVRFSAVFYDLNKEYGDGFSTAYDNINDLNPIKSQNYIFLLASPGASNKGRRFRITRTRRDDSNKEFVKIKAMEIEESGTGWSE